MLSEIYWFYFVLVFGFLPPPPTLYVKFLVYKTPDSLPFYKFFLCVPLRYLFIIVWIIVMCVYICTYESSVHLIYSHTCMSIFRCKKTYIQEEWYSDSPFAGGLFSYVTKKNPTLMVLQNNVYKVVEICLMFEGL